jgi:hypothetical protein
VDEHRNEAIVDVEWIAARLGDPGDTAGSSGNSPRENSFAWASVLSLDDERVAQVPSCAVLVIRTRGNSQESVVAIREAFSGLETDAVPVQCLNVR